ncbi:insulin receptor substrate 2-B-like [Gracilinanus agilis]|uniref:insulin receptor substrate 2-B-like n=1 Tax=Gracilinanus agilis TaxID=191870 RepID=UPI001CFF4527|nr:insulin receptor substrate 2-B-like [Gracilinanus agilis]
MPEWSLLLTWRVCWVPEGTGSSGAAVVMVAAAPVPGIEKWALKARVAVGEVVDDDRAFREVWQVHVKPKGLGQSKNMSGIYRLCLSSKEVHLVRLNAEAPTVQLQLLSIRRCGHSEHFFFLEVGRSSSIGPGEIWMQVDDSVVAQHMHETFLETMKALKAFADFRPRSKSHSSCTNPISFLSTRRHLGYLQPCLGMSRRSRTDSMASSPPSCKGSTYRFRTSSEGEGTMDRPFRTVTGSLMQLNPGRMNPARPESGRYVRAAFNGCCHSRSTSLPVSPFPSGSSPAPETSSRPSSSMCGTPGDGSGVSSADYGPSSGGMRYFRVRNGTPDSVGNTPPIREERAFTKYVATNKQRAKESASGGHREPEKCCKKKTFSLARPPAVTTQQKTTQTSASDLEPAGTPRLLLCSSESVRSRETPKLEHGENGSSRKQGRNHKAEDEGYMAMMPGVAGSLKSNSDYLPMAPKGASASKRPSSSQKDSRGYMMMFPRASSVSPGRNSRGAFSKGASNKDEDNEYMDMSPGQPLAPRQSPEGSSLHPPSFSKSLSSLFSLPKSFRTITEHSDDSDYVPMASPGRLLSTVSEKGRSGNLPPRDIPKAPPTSRAPDGGFPPKKASRPTKLPLGTRGSSVPRVYPRGTGGESPAEYMNMDFSRKASSAARSLSAECSPSSFGSCSDHPQSPFNDYMSFATDGNSPKAAKEFANTLKLSGSNPPPRNQLTLDCARRPLGAAARIRTPTNDADDDYTEMNFNPALSTTTVPSAARSHERVHLDSPSSAVNRLRIVDEFPEDGTFSLRGPRPEPVVIPRAVRAEPQGRRRHSSETFSRARAAATPSSLFLESEGLTSASSDSIWSRAGDGAPDSEQGRMSRVTSAGFQNGLNFIATDGRDAAARAAPGRRGASSGAPNSQRGNGASDLDSGTYVTIDFSRDDIFRCTSSRKGR